MFSSELNETIELKIVPMKQKVISLFFKTRVLRLKRKAVEVLNEEKIRYILIYELIHFKTKDVNHDSSFLRELEKHYSLVGKSL